MTSKTDAFAPGIDVQETDESTFRVEFWMWEAVARELLKPWCDDAIRSDLRYLKAKRLHDGTPYPGRVNLAKRWGVTDYKVRMMVPGWRVQEKARGEVQRAIKAGRMQRLPCEVCAATPTEAHHEDYSKPLDVVFLCKKHHTKRHAEIRAES